MVTGPDRTLGSRSVGWLGAGPKSERLPVSSSRIDCLGDLPVGDGSRVRPSVTQDREPAPGSLGDSDRLRDRRFEDPEAVVIPQGGYLFL